RRWGVRGGRGLVAAPAGRGSPDERPPLPVRRGREPREPQPGGMAGRSTGSQRPRRARAPSPPALEPAGSGHPHGPVARLPPRGRVPSGPGGLSVIAVERWAARLAKVYGTLVDCNQLIGR